MKRLLLKANVAKPKEREDFDIVVPVNDILGENSEVVVRGTEVWEITEDEWDSIEEKTVKLWCQPTYEKNGLKTPSF